jgi:hypothetical protein
MSEDLRAKLKLQRDTENRGHKAESVLKSLEERKADSLKFIQPQRRFADLVVTSSIIDVTNLSDAGPIEVTFESDPKLFDAQLLSELSITCGLEVTTEPIGNNRRKISVRGSSRTADLASAFTALEPRVSAILGAPKSWGEGPAGIIQMVVMVYLGNALRRERLVK